MPHTSHSNVHNPHHNAYGDTIKLVGNTAQLGSWDPANGIALSADAYTAENPVWTAAITLPADGTVSYKFVNVQQDGTVVWESDPNRSLTLPACGDGNVNVDTTWQATGFMERRRVGEL
ncbi:Glucoamylase I [Cyphellophora attinorum]|uniref:Glucoamylase I n=1 Tax=Cyphellophora attinorum TaxID=1664694 RepID=A0A0N0NIU8_9EURO|nr:Glucoamylase I [Phialophora attinorum]KPI36158.1 Glucoamylase I [Phialophora attinorum]